MEDKVEIQCGAPRIGLFRVCLRRPTWKIQWGVKRKTKLWPLEPKQQSIMADTASRLISIIQFIYFPGEARIIIAFRANPISQPLILHRGASRVPPRSAAAVLGHRNARNAKHSRWLRQASRGNQKRTKKSGQSSAEGEVPGRPDSPCVLFSGDARLCSILFSQ